MYFESTQDNLRKAEDASRKALKLDPELAEAHVAHGLAVSLSKRYDEAEKEFEAAIRLDARLFEAHYFYARTCFAQGKLEQAARLFEQASEVRPEDYHVPNLLSQTYVSLGRETEAEVARRRGLELTEKHLELNPDDARALCFGAGALIQFGERERGLEWAQRARALGGPEDVGIFYNLACAYSSAKEIDEALDCLDSALKAGFAHKEWLENDSDLDPLRSHPRFQALLKGMK